MPKRSLVKPTNPIQQLGRLAVGVTVIAVLALIVFWAADRLLAPVSEPTQPLAVRTTSPTPTANPPGWQSVSSFRVPILMYHYIRPLPVGDQLGYNLSIAPASFAKQLDYLKSQGYTTITFRQLSQKVLPPKPVILTFDDGYQDAYTTAFPALRERSMVGTFYIVSGFVGNPNSVTWQQLKEMQAAGMEIGAHSVDHADLAQATAADQQVEIAGSIQEISRQLGRPVTTFAYPAGKWNQTTVELLQQAGMAYAVTTQEGIATSADNPLLLPRVRMFDQSSLAELLQP